MQVLRRRYNYGYIDIFRVIFQLMNTYGFYVIFKLTSDQFKLFFILSYYVLVLYTDLSTKYFFKVDSYKCLNYTR